MLQQWIWEIISFDPSHRLVDPASARASPSSPFGTIQRLNAGLQVGSTRSYESTLATTSQFRQIIRICESLPVTQSDIKTTNAFWNAQDLRVLWFRTVQTTGGSFDYASAMTDGRASARLRRWFFCKRQHGIRKYHEPTLPQVDLDLLFHCRHLHRLQFAEARLSKRQRRPLVLHRSGNSNRVSGCSYGTA